MCGLVAMGEEEKVESELKGNTLRVYWMLLKSQSGNTGVREFQRQLRFSGPALASCHLNKLEELGLVENKKGEYHLVCEVHVGISGSSLCLDRH